LLFLLVITVLSPVMNFKPAAKLAAFVIC